MDGVYLQSLNPAQLRAVQHPPNVPLQILAGPGSGKTKVLTSRIAYLILHHGISPSSICAVTFTNKAANEMRERLTKLIGKEQVSQVKMGTFHAICALFLRRYASAVGLESNFTVCDADESKKIIKKLLEPYREFLEDKNLVLKDSTVLSLISKAKAKGQSPDDYAVLAKRASNQDRKRTAANVAAMDTSISADDITLVTSEIYKEYERTLRRSNSLDFDDLLVFGVKLFSQNVNVVNWCTHVLVDEFQDTNTMQYDLMLHIAAANKCVTIVGDPDQSIYGWRSAEVANLAKMRIDFSATVQIFLEQNYRSTGSILSASLAIVSQDKLRIPKTLQSSHPSGSTPVLRSFSSEHDEAAFIAMEIKRVVASTGAMLDWGSFVVLLRFNALSRTIESTLQKHGIPNRVLGSQRFFERLEIKDLLAYLQIVDNPRFVPAFVRVINVPARGIGEKTLDEILAQAQKSNLSPLELVERIHDSRIPDIKPPVKRKLVSFVKAIRDLRKAAHQNTMPSDLVRRLLHLTEYEEHLKKTQQDWETRWENVQELINFASEVEIGSSDHNLEIRSHSPSEQTPAIEDWDDLPKESEELELDGLGFVEIKPGLRTTDEKNLSGGEDEGTTPLRSFLQASLLSSDSGNEKEEDNKEKVTITTCHSAKGLEWPVVFVPAVEKGTFPFYRSDDVEEERRLLYVACTRAQGLLYLSHPQTRFVAGQSKPRELSPFVEVVAKEQPTIFSSQLPQLTQTDVTQMASVLGRHPPDQAIVTKTLAEYHRTCRHYFFDDTSGPQNILSPSFSTAANHNLLPPPNVAQGRISTVKTTILSPPSFTATQGRYDASHGQKPFGNKLRNALPPQMSTSSQIPSITPMLTTTDRGRAAQPRSIHKPLTPTPSHSSTSLTSNPHTNSFEAQNVDSAIISSEAPTVKRRLGMGRMATGYSNKKFKRPI